MIQSELFGLSDHLKRLSANGDLLLSLSADRGEGDHGIVRCF
jgi:hypothetical protein